MNERDLQLRIDLIAAQYLEAVESDNYELQIELWKLAGAELELEEAFHEINQSLLEEMEEQAKAVVAETVQAHMPSARIFDPAAEGPITVGQVAAELILRLPAGMSPEGVAFIEGLRNRSETVPEVTGLRNVQSWGSATFGNDSRDIWKAFQEARHRLEMQRSATTEYQLAARVQPKKETDRP
jgi:hypothetical protein